LKKEKPLEENAKEVGAILETFGARARDVGLPRWLANKVAWGKNRRNKKRNRMPKKITIKNVMQFIEGNLKMLGDHIDLLPYHEKEQVVYRSWVCRNDCVSLGYCKYCGCSVPGKLYVRESCNEGELFPDMMGASAWEEYKKEKGIDLDELLY